MFPACAIRIGLLPHWALVAFGLSVVLPSLALAAPRTPKGELLGLRLGMSDVEVRKRLERIGSMTEMQPDAGGRKQIWALRDRRYETLNLRLDAKHDLQWCTAYPRARKLRYSEIGDTTLARRAGRTIWIWAVPGSKSAAAYQVTARGTDPVYCSSVVLSQLTARPPGSEPSPSAADSAR